MACPFFLYFYNNGTGALELGYGAVLERAWLLDGTNRTALEAWLRRKGDNPRVLGF
ncbi:hypothetical protein V6Z11_A08G095600 [Gossypium hirsutum]